MPPYCWNFFHSGFIVFIIVFKFLEIFFTLMQCCQLCSQHGLENMTKVVKATILAKMVR